ncbi:MAG: hypothetical protein H6737_05345 [Alphaproteobacteria bacterium]|nr:hypothetical protein [Alphaproteobacteria bacterium]
MKVAVVGHVEQVTFLHVDRAPEPGAILHADRSLDQPAGGGGVAAAELARLAGGCTLYTGLGDDAVGQGIPAALGALGVEVRGSRAIGGHRRAITLVDPHGERTIVVVGPAQHASDGDLAPGLFAGTDAVYFCKGTPAWLRAARAARVLVATARVLPVLREAGVRLDALVHSGRDPGERFAPGDLEVAPALVATTDGEHGGVWRMEGREGRWAAAPVDGPIRDAYGCGDRFAAGLAFALASGAGPDRALALAAVSGAHALSLVGAHGA